jgi:hypothetical protein
MSSPVDRGRPASGRKPLGASEARAVGPLGIGLLGMFLVLLGGLLMVALLSVWPAVEQTTRADGPGSAEVLGMSVSSGTALIALVIVTGGLGSFLHAATSFADYVGNRRLASSWLWWYILRILIGVALALVFYFAVRGGFFAAQSSDQAVNPFGIAALSGLVGLFAKQATDKLREVFDTLFRTAPGRGDDQRNDSIDNPRPHVAGVEPPVIPAGTKMVALRVRGEGFVPESQVRIVRVDTELLLERTATYVNSTELAVQLLQEDLAEAAILQVTVFNPEPGGGISGPVRIHISEAETTAGRR